MPVFSEKGLKYLRRVKKLNPHDMHVEGQRKMKMPELVQIASPMAVLLVRGEPDPPSIGYPASGASGLCRIWHADCWRVLSFSSRMGNHVGVSRV